MSWPHGRFCDIILSNIPKRLMGLQLRSNLSSLRQAERGRLTPGLEVGLDPETLGLTFDAHLYCEHITVFSKPQPPHSFENCKNLRNPRASPSVCRPSLDSSQHLPLSHEKAHFQLFGPSVQSGQSLNRVRLFATPWTAACQASLSITKSRSLLKLTSIESELTFMLLPILLRDLLAHPVSTVLNISKALHVVPLSRISGKQFLCYSVL